MNVLLLIDGLGSGGAQRQFSHLAGGLARRGHRVTVAVYNDQDHFAPSIAEAGVDIVRLPRPSRFSAKTLLALVGLYRQRCADVLITFLRSPAIKAELARLIEPAMKIIAAERTAYPDPPLPLALRITQRLHGLAHFITVNSHRQQLVMAREFPSLADRIVTIRNGVELPDSVAEPSSGAHELRLVAVSSLMPYKNSVRLAQALAMLRDEWNLRVTVSWLGETFEGMTDYGVYRQTCDRIRELGLEEQWQWLGVSRDVLEVLAGHDALVHPSLFEGTSNAVCEAMAHGLPVLAGRVADHDAMLGRSGAGILFDPLEVRSLADAIAQFASMNVKARRDMGRKGRKLIEKYYSFEQMVSDYEALAAAAARGDNDPPGTLQSDDGRFGECAE